MPVHHHRYKIAMITFAVTVLAACGAESPGLLSDHLVCDSQAATIEADVAAADLEHAGSETNVNLPVTSASATQPGLAQYFTTTGEENIWGFAIKLVAPFGAPGDVRVSLLDNNIAVGGVPLVHASTTIAASQIGTTPTWLLVKFGDFVALSPLQTVRLALTSLYDSSSDKPVAWITAPGSGLESYTEATFELPGFFSSVGRQGIYLTERCE